MRCVWLKAYERSERLPLWRGHINRLRPPVDNRLKGTSSWANLLSGRDRQTPPGWAGSDPGVGGTDSGSEAGGDVAP
jgi:hypothetical protein